MERQRVAEIEPRGRRCDVEGRQSLAEPGELYQVNIMHVHMYPSRRSGSSLDTCICFCIFVFSNLVRNDKHASGPRLDSPV